MSVQVWVGVVCSVWVWVGVVCECAGVGRGCV